MRGGGGGVWRGPRCARNTERFAGRSGGRGGRAGRGRPGDRRPRRRAGLGRAARSSWPLRRGQPHGHRLLAGRARPRDPGRRPRDLHPSGRLHRCRSVFIHHLEHAWEDHDPFGRDQRVRAGSGLHDRDYRTGQRGNRDSNSSASDCALQYRHTGDPVVAASRDSRVLGVPGVRHPDGGGLPDAGPGHRQPPVPGQGPGPRFRDHLHLEHAHHSAVGHGRRAVHRRQPRHAGPRPGLGAPRADLAARHRDLSGGHDARVRLPGSPPG